jgi:hypothetical protein
MSHPDSDRNYNYTTFIGDDDFAAFRSLSQSGDQAPDGIVVDVTSGEERQLSSYWKDHDLVIEFGSLT